MRIGVVLVHYRTPELAQRAVEALRRTEDLDGDLEIVLVDNSAAPGSDDAPEILRRLETSHGVRYLDPGANRGYAGGVNRGVEELGACDVYVPMNPDVEVEPACLRELVRSLGEGSVGVAGPRFFWDRPGGFLMPPTEQVGRRRELARYLAARRGGGRARRARAAWRRHARRHWTATGDLPSHALSGALLAIDADAWTTVGPFDDGYRLYFEETDWLERARRRGIAGAYVPAARAVHHFARSTPKEPRSAQWFAESAARFRRRWYGDAFARFLERLARRWPPRPGEVDDGAPPDPPSLPAAGWIELSTSPLGFPALGRRAEGLTELPAAAAQRARETAVYWRTVDAGGRESAAERVEPEAG